MPLIPRYIDPADGGTILGEGLTVLGPTGARKLALRTPDTFRTLYVSPTGDDAVNPGTAAAPFRTPQRAVDEIGPLGVGIVYSASGSYVHPVMRGIRGPVVFAPWAVPGDDGWTEVVPSAAAGAGSGAGAVKGTFAPDAHRHDTLEVLSGAAAGRQVEIVDNDSTDLVPSYTLTGLLAGDTYRIIRPAVRWTGFTNESWLQNCGAPGAFVTKADAVNMAHQGIWLYGVGLDAAASCSVTINRSQVYAFGLDCSANINWTVSDASLISGLDSYPALTDGQIASFLGHAEGKLSGLPWIRRGGSLLVNGSRVGGYLSGPGAQLYGGTKWEQYGGYIRGQLWAFGGSDYINISALFAASRVSGSGSSAAVQVSDGGSAVINGGVQLAAPGSGAAIRAQKGGQVSVSGSAVLSSVSGDCINAARGGRVYVLGTPSGWTSGGVDLRVSATETAAQGTLTAAEDTLAAVTKPNGSIITRAS